MRIFLFLLLWNGSAWSYQTTSDCGHKGLRNYRDLSVVAYHIDVQSKSSEKPTEYASASINLIDGRVLPTGPTHVCLEGAYQLKDGRISNKEWERLRLLHNCGFR